MEVARPSTNGHEHPEETYVPSEELGDGWEHQEASVSEGERASQTGAVQEAVAQKTLAGRYALEDRIQRSYLADTFRGTDLDSGRSVAVTVFSDRAGEHQQFRQRLLQLANALATFDHPSIAAVLDAGIIDGRPYVISELVEGQSLREVLEQTRRLPVERVVSIGTQVAEALAYAHQRGLIHGDLRPDNIVVGEHGKLKITDFGQTRLAVSFGLIPLDSLAESVPYLSPEQVMGSQPSQRSDIYSLAAILYEALAGLPPFGGTNALVAASQRLVREPASLRRARPDVPLELDNAILRALVPNPVERYRDANEFRAALLERELALQAAAMPAQWGGREERVILRPRRSILEHIAVAAPLFATLAVVAAAFLFYTLVMPKALSFVQFSAAPDLSGRPLAEAAQIARGVGLDVTVESLQPTNDQPKDVVLAQIPGPGTQLSHSSPIKLVISQGIRTPDVRQMSVNDARITLVRNGWKTGGVETQLAPGVPPGMVVGQKPGPGEVVPDKRDVVLIVSGGSQTAGAQLAASSGDDTRAAVDGDEQTYWMPTAPAPQWIELRLQSPIVVGAMELVPAQPRSEPTIVEIWVTMEGGEFLPIHTFRETTSDGQALRFKLDQPADRVVAVRVATTMSAGGVGWREIKVLASGS